MSQRLVMSMMSTVEFLLWAVFCFLFWRKRLYSRFPAMGAYLALRLVSTPVLLALLLKGSLLASERTCLAIYFFLYWAVYIASAVLLFFICVEIFHSALSAFSGLQRLGTLAFRWVALVSVIISVSQLSFVHLGLPSIPEISYALMRSVSILEMCLLAFLCLSMNTLRLSVRDMAFGIAVGFGLMSANDFIFAAASHSSLTDSVQFLYEALILVVLGVWVAYGVLPEPVRKPVVLPVDSTIFRWNEIASALGHTGTQVAVQQPGGGFFLTDAERSAERVLVRNLKGSESES
jgi:hypothetical protein